MIRILSMILVAVVASAASAQDSGARARAALALAQPQAPLVRVEPAKPAYPAWNAEVAAKRKQTAVFVGVKARDVPGMLICEQPIFPDVQGPAVVVARIYSDGQVYWHATLPATASDLDIRRAAGWEVEPLAIPFVAPRQPRTADDSDLGRGPWPKLLEFPEGMQRYRRANWTQEIAVTNERDRITPVHRLNLERKWHQSGGMDGVAGYRSDLYRLAPSEPRTFVGNIGVLNSFGHVQHNRGWRREYADGTRFDDVLSNTETGKVFEHRTAQKKGGTWTRRVLFSDEAERPKGYAGLSQSCSSCHDQAGSGGYATGLVPGGDTILSDPFSALEQ